MTDSLIDDVEALLNGEFGDDRILKQIHRACQNNEVISNFERNYVKNLAEKHLGRKPKIQPQAKPQQTTTPTPPIVNEIPPTPQKLQSIQTTPRVTKRNSNSSRILIGIGGVALIAIIAIATSMSSPSDISPSESKSATALMIQTDFSSYNFKDIISINGKSNISGQVNLSIFNQNNDLVWAEKLSTKSDGRYSTLAIAGGEGWNNSGTYTIEVDNGSQKQSTTFSFER
jgi:hypothetical protein